MNKLLYKIIQQTPTIMKCSLYLRDHKTYQEDGVYKLGITDNLAGRESVYKTGEYEPGHYILVIEFYSNNPKAIDDFSKTYFKPLHRSAGGGTEFYAREILNLVSGFLENAEKTFDIQFSIINSDDYDLTRKYRERHSKKITNYFHPIKESSISHHLCDVKNNITEAISRDNNRLEIIRMEQLLCDKLNDPESPYNIYNKPPIYIVKHIIEIIILRKKSRVIPHIIIPIQNIYIKYTIDTSISMLCWCKYPL